MNPHTRERRSLYWDRTPCASIWITAGTYVSAEAEVHDIFLRKSTQNSSDNLFSGFLTTYISFVIIYAYKFLNISITSHICKEHLNLLQEHIRAVYVIHTYTFYVKRLMTQLLDLLYNIQAYDLSWNTINTLGSIRICVIKNEFSFNTQHKWNPL